jgi:hypothetical protein
MRLRNRRKWPSIYVRDRPMVPHFRTCLHAVRPWSRHYDRRPPPEQLPLAAHSLAARGAQYALPCRDLSAGCENQSSAAGMRAVHPLGKPEMIVSDNGTELLVASGAIRPGSEQYARLRGTRGAATCSSRMSRSTARPFAFAFAPKACALLLRSSRSSPNRSIMTRNQADPAGH